MHWCSKWGLAILVFCTAGCGEDLPPAQGDRVAAQGGIDQPGDARTETLTGAGERVGRDGSNLREPENDRQRMQREFLLKFEEFVESLEQAQDLSAAIRAAAQAHGDWDDLARRLSAAGVTAIGEGLPPDYGKLLRALEVRERALDERVNRDPAALAAATEVLAAAGGAGLGPTRVRFALRKPGEGPGDDLLEILE